MLLSRFLRGVKVLGTSRAKTRSNPAFSRTHRKLIRGVIPREFVYHALCVSSEAMRTHDH
jgi:hypothetical protein